MNPLVELKNGKTIEVKGDLRTVVQFRDTVYVGGEGVGEALGEAGVKKSDLSNDVKDWPGLPIKSAVADKSGVVRNAFRSIIPGGLSSKRDGKNYELLVSTDQIKSLKK